MFANRFLTNYSGEMVKKKPMLKVTINICFFVKIA